LERTWYKPAPEVDTGHGAVDALSTELVFRFASVSSAVCVSLAWTVRLMKCVMDLACDCAITYF